MRSAVIVVLTAVQLFGFQFMAESKGKYYIAKFEPDVRDERQQCIREFKDLKTAFSSEPRFNARFNNKILDLKKDQISVLEDMLDAIRDGDEKSFYNLADKKTEIEYELKRAFIKKEEARFIDELEFRAGRYDDDLQDEINEILDKLKDVYSRISDVEHDIYKSSRELKELQRAKDHLLRKARKKLRKAEKNYY